MPTEEEYSTLLDAGLCPRCGRRKTTEGTISCRLCLERDKRNYMSRKARLRELDENTYWDEEKKTKSSASWIFLDPERYRVGLLDIEATGLTGGYHIVLCAVIKIYGRKETKTFQLDISRLDLLSEEKRMLSEIGRFITGLDGVITYYGSRYDVPMLRTRMMFHGMDPFEKQKHLDMYYTIRNITNLERRRMANVDEMLRRSNPGNSPGKTRISISQWTEAVFARSKPAMAYIVDHCNRDVAVLENIVDSFEKYVPDRVMRK